MKIISVIFCLLLSWTSSPLGESYLIICGKKIIVDGSTNIGSFRCQYSESEQNDTIFFSKKRKAALPYAFSLKVPQFSCGNFLLNKDFQKTLRAEKHPQVVVEVMNLHPYKNGDYLGSVKLEIVGKSKVIKNLHFFEDQNEDQRILTTDFTFSASEFNLNPPKRLGGLVEAEDCMNISVNLRLN